MEAGFWHNRWENELTGFHLNEVNDNLKSNWTALNLKEGARVFVPLCGKSLDLIWLAEQGHEVVGIELSPLAVEAFFSENKLEATQTQINGMDVWKSDKISLFSGDIFKLTPEMLGKIDAVYDRASLIALPPKMRQDYALKLDELVKSAPKLLVTLEYDQSKMDGPPFSVSEEEINTLYEAKYQVNRLFSQNVLDENDSFRKKGLDYMNECIYLLQRMS